MFDDIGLFNGLSKEELSTLENFCQERKIKKGEILFEKGDESNSMYIVKSGKLQAYIDDKILGNIIQGEFVGEMSIFSDPKVRTASVKAIEETDIIILLSFSIHQLSQIHPEIVEKIKDVIKERKKENSK